jgi:hypothetical protein
MCGGRYLAERDGEDELLVVVGGAQQPLVLSSGAYTPPLGRSIVA